MRNPPPLAVPEKPSAAGARAVKRRKRWRVFVNLMTISVPDAVTKGYEVCALLAVAPQRQIPQVQEASCWPYWLCHLLYVMFVWSRRRRLLGKLKFGVLNGRARRARRLLVVFYTCAVLTCILFNDQPLRPMRLSDYTWRACDINNLCRLAASSEACTHEKMLSSQD